MCGQGIGVCINRVNVERLDVFRRKCATICQLTSNDDLLESHVARRVGTCDWLVFNRQSFLLELPLLFSAQLRGGYT